MRKEILDDLFLTTPELSKIIKVAPATIRGWLRDGYIPEDAIFKMPCKKGTVRFITEKIIPWALNKTIGEV